MALTPEQIRRWLPMRLEERVLLDADPAAAVSAPATDFINETTDFTITFDNQGVPTPADDAIGYGPFLDITLQSGIESPQANYLGQNVPLQEIATWEITPTGPAWVVAGGDPANVNDVLQAGDHPLGAALPLPQAPSDPTGDGVGTTWYQIVAPFGSYGPDQPALPVAFSASLDQGALPTGAIVDEPLEITARGGFRFGNDPIENPTDDPPIAGATNTSTITPTVYQIEKSLDLPDGANGGSIPAGPNYPYAFVIRVDVANGLDPTTPVLTDLDIRDSLPPELFYTGVNSLTVNGVLRNDLLATQPDTAGSPGVFDLAALVPEVFGTLANDEVVIRIEAYTPEVAVGTGAVEIAGNDLVTQDAFRSLTFDNTADASALYEGNPLLPITDDTSITVIPVAIVKTASVDGGGQAVPGATINYAHDVSVSDFVIVSGLPVTDVLDDGLLLDTASIFLDPTPGAPGSGDEIQLVPGQDGVSVTTNGQNQTVLSFDIVTLTGGTPIAGDLALDPVQNGAVQFRLSYQAEIQDRRSDGSPIRDGDVLDNTASLTAEGDGVTTPPVTNGSSGTVGVANITGDKEVFQINGVDPMGNQEIKAGDEVTFVIEIRVPTGDIDNLQVQDFPPLPIFDVAQIDPLTAWQGRLFPTQIPGPGEVAVLFSKDGTLGADPTNLNGGAAPTIVVRPTSNALTINFGNLDDPTNQTRTVFLAYTLVVSDEPFADGLALTNQAVTSGVNSAGQLTTIIDIEQVVLRQPELSVQKGVVSVSNTNASLTAAAGPVAFAAAGSIGPAFTTDITASALAATPIDANVSDLDAGDIVRFAITAQNTGGEDAFDISLADDLAPFLNDGLFGLFDPDGAGPIAAGNLQALYGDQSVATVDSSAFFTTGVLTVANANADGSGLGDAADLPTDEDGSDILVITYDLEVLGSAPSAFATTNSVVLDGYGAVDGGNNFLAGVGPADLPQDTASSDGAPVVVAKQITDTGLAANGGNVAIGELTFYEVTLTLPESAFDEGGVGITIADLLPAGTEFIGAPLLAGGTLVLDDAVAGVVEVDLTGFAGAAALVVNGATVAAGTTGQVALTPGGTITGGQSLALNIGAFSLPGTPESVANNVVLRYVTRPVDVDGPANGDALSNQLAVTPANAVVVNASAQVDVVEPTPTVVKRFTDAGGNDIDTVSAGGAIFVEFEIANTGGAATPLYFTEDSADAPALLDGSLQALVVGGNPVFSIVGAAAGSDARFALDPTDQVAGIIRFDPADLSGGVDDIQLDPGDSITLTVELLVAANAPIGALITNTATATGFSVPAQAVDSNGAIGREARPYSVVGQDVIAIDAVDVTKILTNTSVGNDTSPLVVIGEVVTYEVAVAIPDGSADLVTVTDTAEPGLVVTGAAIVDALGPISDPPVLVTTAGGFTLSLANVLNSPAAAEDNTIVAEVTAIVANVAGNQDGVIRTNAAQQATTAIGTTTTTPASTVDVEIVEPVLQVAKTAVPASGFDAGDTIAFTITLDHAGASRSDAFDLGFLDIIDAAFTIDPSSLAVADDGGTGLTSAAFQVVGQQIQLVAGTDFDLLQTESFVLTYNAAPNVTVQPGQILLNQVAATWTSIDGANPFERTGPSPPGNPNPPNDYVAGATLQLTVAQELTIAKAADKAEAAIGEFVTFTLDVGLIEGTTPGVVVSDAVPLGFTNVNVVSAVQGDGTPQSFVQSYDPSTGSLVVDLGTVVLAGDNNPANDVVTITYTATLNDAVANLGDTLTNSAGVAGGGLTPPPNASVDVDIVGPTVTIAKTATPNATQPTDAGNLVTYVVTLDNLAANGATSSAFDVGFADTLPFDVDFVEVTGATGGLDPALFTFNAATRQLSYTGDLDLAVDGAATVTYTATLADTVQPASTLTNTATTEWSSLDGPVPGERVETAATTASITLDSVFDLQKDVIATDQPDDISTGTDVVIGEVVTFELSLELAEGTTTALAFTDQLPPGLTFIGLANAEVGGVAVTPTVTQGPSDGALTFAFGDVVLPGDNNLANNFVTVAYRARVGDLPTSQNGTVLTNAATAAGGGFTDADTAQVDVVTPILDLAKTVDGGEQSVIARGETATYTIVLSNDAAAGAAAFDIAIDDNLVPPGITIDPATVNAVGSAGAVNVQVQTGSPLAVTADSLAPGATITITFDGDATTSTDFQFNAARLVNTASYGASSLPGDVPGIERPFAGSDTATVIIVGPDISLTKTVSEVLDADGNPGPVAVPGGVVTFQILVENIGVPEIDDPAEDAPDVVVREDIPLGLTFVDAVLIDPTIPGDPGVAIVPTLDPVTGELLFSIGTLPRDTAFIIETRTSVDDPAPAGADLIAGGGSDFDLVNVVTTTGIDGSNDNDEDEADVPLVAVPDLTILKTDGLDAVEPGEQLTYRVTVENVGDQIAGGVQVVDSFDDAVLNFASASNGGVYDPTAQTITWNFDRLSPTDGPLVLLVNAVVDDVVPAGRTSVVNTVVVSDDGLGGADPTPDNNFAEDVDQLIAAPDLIVLKSDGVTTAQPGDRLTYTLSVANVGNQVATGVQVVDVVDGAVLDFVAASAGGTFDPASGEVFWSFGALSPAQGSVQLIVTADVRKPASAGLEQIENVVTVAEDGSNGPDPTPANNQAVDIDILDAAPDLVVAKTTSTPGPIGISGEAVFTLVVTNQGNQNATSVVVTDPISLGFDFVSASDGGEVENGAVVWRLGDVAVGTEITLTVTFAAGSDASLPETVNVATVFDDGSNGPDLDPANNTDSASVLVSFIPDLPPFTDTVVDDSLFGPLPEQGIDGFLDEYFERQFELDQLIPQTFIFTGTVEPGSAIRVSVGGNDGSNLGSVTVLSDAAGNWLANLAGVEDLSNQTVAPELTLAPTATATSSADFVTSRSYFAPASLGSFASVREVTTEEVFANRASVSLDAAIEAVRNLALRTANQPYVSNLQASSSTVSQS